jgi:UDP-N-acetylglucosamine 2-epimerase (non-hydrolysing)
VTRHVAVFTSSRADLGPLGPVIDALDAHPDVELLVIATGTHLLDAYGGRLADIQLSNGTLEVVDARITGTSASELGEAYGRIAAGTSAILAERSVDILLVLGDRWELLAAAGAALLHGVPIAHLHGGETTEGAIDERIRHSITKLADLHLCASDDSARRIRRLGEEAWRIVVTGAPGLDRVASAKAVPESELEEITGHPLIRPFGVVVYHPPTVGRQRIAERTRAVLDAAAETLGSCLVLYPGADPGGDDVVRETDAAVARHHNVAAVRNLGNDYLGVLKTADVLVGNSSSGLIETASLGLPTVDIGDRQSGRVRPRNVIHVVDDESAIRGAIRNATSSSFRLGLTGLRNPYGDGHASERILRALLEAPLDRLSHKPLLEAPLPHSEAPVISIPTSAHLREAMSAIDRGRAQIALVVFDDGTFAGTITDGDVRRALLDGASMESGVAEHMTIVPIVASPDDDPATVLAMMDREQVTQVPVIDDTGRVVGLHLMRSMVSRAAGLQSAE